MERVPLTLYDLLSNSVILCHLAPYLPTSSTYNLAATSKSYHSLVLENASETFRYLDLSCLPLATISSAPLDPGGFNWRSQRMDEALTEDEFYSGPLRGAFSKLSRNHILKNVQTLILDGLNVPADLVQQIISEERFNVRVLSVREARHLNERKLMQVLEYAVRPSRPANTPRLRALYIFGQRNPGPQNQNFNRDSQAGDGRISGVTASEGAQIGASWNERSQDALYGSLERSNDPWYRPAGKVLKKPLPEWAYTIKACEGVVAFDAVLCRGPRHDLETCIISNDTCLPPRVATISLGPNGCSSCNSSPEGAVIFGRSPSWHLPLLSPPPLHSASVRAAQAPFVLSGVPPSPYDSLQAGVGEAGQECSTIAYSGLSPSFCRSPLTPLYLRCEDCLRGRWCERCNRWWDENCYSSSVVGRRVDEPSKEFSSKMTESTKVHLDLCIEHCLVGEMMSGAGSCGMWG